MALQMTVQGYQNGYGEGCKSYHNYHNGCHNGDTINGHNHKHWPNGHWLTALRAGLFVIGLGGHDQGHDHGLPQPA